jgi:hypothetical protein
MVSLRTYGALQWPALQAGFEGHCGTNGKKRVQLEHMTVLSGSGLRIGDTALCSLEKGP